MKKSLTKKIGYFYISFFIFYFLWYIFRPGGQIWLKIFSNTVYFVPLLLSLISLTVVSLKTKNKERLFWILVLAGTILYLFGDVIFSYYDLILGQEVPSPSIADIGYIGFYFPIFIALLIAYSQIKEKAYLALTLNSIIFILALFIFSWNTILLPLIGETKLSLSGILSNFSYPLGDLTILSLLVLLFYSSYQRLSSPLVYLALSFGLFAIGDSIYFYTVINNIYYSGHPVDLYWVAGFLLLSMSATERVFSKEWVFKFKKMPANELKTMIFLKDRIPIFLAVAAAVYIFIVAWRGIISSVNLTIFTIMLSVTGARIGMNTIQQSHFLREQELLSIIDKRSGLYSKYYFKQRLSHEILRSIQQKTPLSLIMISLNIFNKNFEKLGFEKNLVYSNIIKSIEKSTRVFDVRAQLNDDTFVIMAVDTEHLRALDIAKHIKISLDSELPEFLADKLKLGIGIADFPEATVKKDVLFNCAKSAMNEALKRGGDKIIYFGDIGKLE